MSILELSAARELATRSQGTNIIETNRPSGPNWGHPSDTSRPRALTKAPRSCTLLSIQLHNLATTRCPYHRPQKSHHFSHYADLTSVTLFGIFQATRNGRRLFFAGADSFPRKRARSGAKNSTPSQLPELVLALSL